MELDSQDAWIFILSTIRYSMGRRTYMTQLSQDLFHKYKSCLTASQIDQIYQEVASELQIHEDLNTTLGGKIDHELWKEFIDGKVKSW